MIIVVQSHLSKEHYLNDQGEQLFTYHLTRALNFTEPHYAKLLYIGGIDRASLIFTDFIASQEVSGNLEPFLGSSGVGTERDWVALASNYIPTSGYIQVRYANTSNITKESNITCIILIESESNIHGAKGTS
jgi:hypothetical protein